jgi:hypothetical protein
VSTISQRIERLRVRVTTLDGRVSAELFDRQVMITMGRGYYREASERSLANTLTSLARLLSVAHARECRAIIGQEGGESITARNAFDPLDAEYLQQLGGIVARGSAAGGRIRAHVRGMSDWSVEIDPGTLNELSEPAFLAETQGLAGEIISDYLNQAQALRWLVYAD